MIIFTKSDIHHLNHFKRNIFTYIEPGKWGKNTKKTLKYICSYKKGTKKAYPNQISLQTTTKQ